MFLLLFGLYIQLGKKLYSVLQDNRQDGEHHGEDQRVRLYLEDSMETDGLTDARIEDEMRRTQSK